jgi:hypothetical protein
LEFSVATEVVGATVVVAAGFGKALGEPTMPGWVTVVAAVAELIPAAGAGVEIAGGTVPGKLPGVEMVCGVADVPTAPVEVAPEVTACPNK